MQGAGWKLTVLAASIAIGFVVLMQVQKNLEQSQTSQKNSGAKVDPALDGESGDKHTHSFVGHEPTLAKPPENNSGIFSPKPFPGSNEPNEPAVAKFTRNAFAPNEATPKPFPETNSPASNNVATVYDPFKSATPAPKAVATEQSLNSQTQTEFKPADPFAGFTTQLNQQVEQKQNQLNNIVSNVTQNVNKRVEQVDQQVDQWNSSLTNAANGVQSAANNVQAIAKEKVELIAGEFSGAAPLENVVQNASQITTEVQKSSSTELIELTRNLTGNLPSASKMREVPKKLEQNSGFPTLTAPQIFSSKQAQPITAVPVAENSFPVPAQQPNPVSNVSGGFPAPAFGSPPAAENNPTKNSQAAPFEQPAFLSPPATTEKKPFFDRFPPAQKAPESKPANPFQSVPKFNAQAPSLNLNQNPLPKVERKPAPLQFQPEPVPTGNHVAPAEEVPAFPFSASQPILGNGPVVEQPQQPQPIPITPATPKPVSSTNIVNEADPGLMGTAKVDAKIPERLLQPKIELYKTAPENAVLGQPLVYKIEIENVGVVAVKEVVVEDKFPAGTKLTGTIPRAELVDNKLVWKFEELSPGERKKILVRVVPIKPGNIGSISTVSYKSTIAAQTLVTAPKLELLLDSDEQVAIGETAKLHFIARNTGDGDARDVVLRNLIPAGFEHPAGADLEYDLGTIEPGGKKEVTLMLNAKKSGIYKNVASIHAVGGFKADTQSSTEVIPSVLTLKRNSPTRRFVGHAMTQDTSVKNHSNRQLNQVTIIEHVPAGFRFKKASDNGLYSSELRTITWTVGQLPAGQEVEFTSTLTPTTIGTQTVRVKAQDASGHHAEIDSTIKVEGFSSLAVRVPDARGPVAKGERVSIRFKVINRGSAQATRVFVNCKIPAHLQYVSSNGPVKAQANGQFIQFQPIVSLGANQEATFDLVFSSTTTGDGNVEFEVTSDQARNPIKHHEQVVVYGD